MTLSRNPYVAALTTELERAGVSEFDFTHGGKHPRVTFTVAGQERFYVFPNSPSDSQRGVLNAVAGLRKMLGIAAPKAVKSTRAAKIRTPERAPGLPDGFTVKEDPMAALRAWKPPPLFDWTRASGREWIVTRRLGGGRGNG